MKRPSFRLRIALLSSALAGSALIGLGAVAWVQIYSAKISRLDAELINQLMRSTRSPDRERWQFYADSLPLGTPPNTPIALLVRSADGDRLYQSTADPEVKRLLTESFRLALPPPPLREPPPFPPASRTARPLPPRPQFVTERTATGAWRIGAANFPHLSVAIAVNLQAVNQEMATIRNIFLISIPGVLLLVAVGSWLVAGSALGSVHQLTSAIQQVTVQGLDQRIPVGATDVEFIKLIQVFNQMLERLERSFSQASRFSGDAAHELKTPLTILQGELERSLQQVEPGSELQQRLSNLLDEVGRLNGIIRKLLLLSLADAGQISLVLAEVNLSELLVEMLEDVELLAPDLTVTTEIASELRVQGDRDLLIQVLQNLFSNAIKYNLDQGWIQIQARQTGSQVQIKITNASPDIVGGDRDRIFERFHRGDPARTRQIEGIGLGLSLAREIARAHRGDLTLDPSALGQTAFTLSLPI